MKKLLFSTFLSLCLIFSSVSAFAVTYTYDSSDESFTDDWELIDSGSTWIIKYGYNTALINEDYTHTYSSSFHHTATVSNNNGAFTDEDSAGSWAGIEVTHSGSYIQYSITY